MIQRTLFGEDAPWLVVDANNLGCRAWYAMRNVGADRAEGMLYGFFRDVRALERQFGTNKLAFCFDSRHSLRRQIYHDYKANRVSEEDAGSRHRMFKTIRREYLPRLGYANVFHHKGYEADDLMASVVQHNQGGFVLVSTDKDLYQLLSPTVRIWRPPQGPHSPGQHVTDRSFKKEYGIRPRTWAKVKAITGCSTDNVAGVRGVGEKYAIAYLNGTLNKATKAFQAIVASERQTMQNRVLVRLPYPDCPECRLQDDQPDQRAWNKLMTELDMPSLT